MYKDNKLPVSFAGKSGRFYVLRNEGLTNPTIPKKYAAYSSTDAYNARSEVPFYIDAAEALIDYSAELKIYIESLTTTPPVYPPEPDESDYGLTPERNYWHNRFQMVRGDQSHAA